MIFSGIDTANKLFKVRRCEHHVSSGFKIASGRIMWVIESRSTLLESHGLRLLVILAISIMQFLKMLVEINVCAINLIGAVLFLIFVQVSIGATYLYYVKFWVVVLYLSLILLITVLLPLPLNVLMLREKLLPSIHVSLFWLVDTSRLRLVLLETTVHTVCLWLVMLLASLLSTFLVT